MTAALPASRRGPIRCCVAAGRLLLSFH